MLCYLGNTSIFAKLNLQVTLNHPKACWIWQSLGMWQTNAVEKLFLKMKGYGREQNWLRGEQEWEAKSLNWSLKKPWWSGAVAEPYWRKCCARGCSGLPNTPGGNILMQITSLQRGIPLKLWKFSLCEVYISTRKTFTYMLNFVCVE